MTLTRLALAAALLVLAATAGAVPWVQADRDGDGVLTFEEAQDAYDELVRPRFDTADANGDGVLTEREFRVLDSIQTIMEEGD
jgi:EF hand